jgi:hypothetical protein
MNLPATNLILRSPPKAGVSKEGQLTPISSVAVLRDGVHRSAFADPCTPPQDEADHFICTSPT